MCLSHEYNIGVPIIDVFHSVNLNLWTIIIFKEMKKKFIVSLL